MKKFYGSYLIFIPFICGIIFLIVSIVSFIYLIINFNVDNLVGGIVLFIVATMILPWFIFCRKYIFYKVGFDENGIYKFYKNQLLFFIAYDEIKSISIGIIPFLSILNLKSLTIAKTKFDKITNKNAKTYLIENISFQITANRLKELAKYKDKIKVDIKDNHGNKIDNIF